MFLWSCSGQLSLNTKNPGKEIRWNPKLMPSAPVQTIACVIILVSIRVLLTYLTQKVVNLHMDPRNNYKSDSQVMKEGYILHLHYIVNNETNSIRVQCSED